jgi:flagellar motor switch protein FliN
LKNYPLKEMNRMSDGAISQDEIDALLSGVDMGGLGTGGQASSATAVHLDTGVLTDFAGGLKAKLTDNLKTMTGSTFDAGTPVVETVNRDQLLAKLPEMVVAVMADFSTALKGDHLFIMTPDFAQKLTGLINKEENAELDDMALSVISEVVSQHSGAEITELSKGGKLPGLATNPPEAVNVPKAMVRIPQNTFALFSYPLTLDGQAYTLWEAVSSDVASGMIQSLGGSSQSAQAGTLSSSDVQSMGQFAGMQQQVPGRTAMQQGYQQMPQMQQGMMMGNMQMNSGMMGMNVPNVQSLQYPALQGGPAASEQGNIGLIMDVFMEMTVELGRTKKQIKEILGMGEGTIIELDKLAGEPVDILVNHKPIAKGEVVVIDENFGVRVTEILSPMERVSDLH